MPIVIPAKELISTMTGDRKRKFEHPSPFSRYITIAFPSSMDSFPTHHPPLTTTPARLVSIFASLHQPVSTPEDPSSGAIRRTMSVDEANSTYYDMPCMPCTGSGGGEKKEQPEVEFCRAGCWMDGVERGKQDTGSIAICLGLAWAWETWDEEGHVALEHNLYAYNYVISLRPARILMSSQLFRYQEAAGLTIRPHSPVSEIDQLPISHDNGLYGRDTVLGLSLKLDHILDVNQA
ncbi:hypothetical protein CONLIGDRAFT_647756 [Coniochaeta ligniaria NRRL 30616]|uniref:Uncharacterized protein n=1 Tax=Coniochaeta ligniaria NRRL 30616 TaxID=1408157 RepID=A0A1J7IF46_9PEZI|nr:hypothetical protein CONLIGDRAFT_647756 [Coniochaeta ligniaria NRRL 30616]